MMCYVSGSKTASLIESFDDNFLASFFSVDNVLLSLLPFSFLQTPL